jgi:hypothetical protein
MGYPIVELKKKSQPQQSVFALKGSIKTVENHINNEHVRQSSHFCGIKSGIDEYPEK